MMINQIAAGKAFDTSAEEATTAIRFEYDRGATQIILGDATISIDSEWGRNPNTNRPSLRLCNDEVREKISELFPNANVAKFLFDSVIDALKKDLNQKKSELKNYELAEYKRRPADGLRSEL